MGRTSFPRRGLTLIEILLSILVLVIGILGIMALFPAALITSKDTIDQRHGANLAESVKNAVSDAFRFQYPAGTLDVDGDGTADAGKMVMTHDMSKAGGNFPYLFYPPVLDGVTGMTDRDATATISYRRHPPNGADGPGGTKIVRHSSGAQNFPSPGKDPVNGINYPFFRLATEAWVNANRRFIKGEIAGEGGNDPTEAYDQYVFNFDLAKVYTLQYLEGDPKPTGGNWTRDELDLTIRLYEARINIMRCKGDALNVANDREHILTVTHRVAIK
jgi:hypothetical protein